MSDPRLLFRLARFRFHIYLLSGLLASFLFYVFPLVPGLIVRQVFDDLTNSAHARFGIPALIALLVAVGIGRFVAIFAAVAAETTAGLIAATLLRKNLFERILERPGAKAVPYSPGEAISRFRDDVLAVMRFLTWTLDPVGQTVVAAFAIIILLRINPLFTLAVFLPLAAVLSVVNMSNRRIRRYRRLAQEGIGEVTNFLGEVFGAALAVKVAGAEERVVRHFGTLNESRRKATVNDVLFTQIVTSVAFNAGNLGTGVLLLLIGSSMRSGSFTVGDFALFVSYLTWLTTLTGMFGQFLTLYRQATVSLDRMKLLLQGAPEEQLVRHGPVYLRGPFPDVPYLAKTDADRLERLEVCGLTYRYPDSGRGVGDISFEFDRGQLVVLTGRIGAGKTTLLRTLLGLLPAERGEWLWNSERIADPARFLTPPRVAYTAQAPRLFSDTLRDNILLGIPEQRADLVGAVRAAVLERDVAEMDHGFDTRIGPRGVRLSGGQIQRTAAARMFVRDAELFVFDDLSSALDVETEGLLWQRLAERGDRTYLVVSHRRPLLQRADKIVVLKSGLVEASGRLQDLLQTSAEMQRLWREE